MPKPNSFTKAERISSERTIEQLFSSGSRSLVAFPVRAVYRIQPCDGVPVKVLLSVAKRRLHHAVDRNRTKRQLREAYRTHKAILWEAIAGRTLPSDEVDEAPKPMGLNIAFVWLSEELCDTTTVEKSIVNLLQRIAEKL